MQTRSRFPLRLGAAAALITLAGCGFIGGSANPRPDDPAARPPDRPAGAVSWSSLDWQDVTFERPAKASVEQWDRAADVATGPGGWVAVGSNNDVMGYVGRIWHSPDGLAWTLVDDDLLDGLELLSVTATPDAWVAIGTRSANPNAPVTSMLRSTDGVTWSEVETVDGAWGFSVASGQPGFVAIVEADANDLLLSPDGLTWRRVPAEAIGTGITIADVAWDGTGWIAAGSAGDRAVALRSADGTTWTEEALPAAGPVAGILDVSAYRVVPGRWATLLLGIDRTPSCAEDDEWCDKYQAAWSRTAANGWQRLPAQTWILDRGWGVDAFAAQDAGFLYLFGDDARTSADGWEWSTIRSSGANVLTRAVAVDGDRVIAVGTPNEGDELDGWFGSAIIGR